jgi:EAL domain-containing protein (putative c-di-GMP-specific phosphodiesterase class I)
VRQLISPQEFVLPLYRATHRQPAANPAIRLRPPRGRRPGLVDELTQPATLAAAIELDQLRLFYHPIVHLAGTTVVGHEVLIRWQHPQYGLLAPSDFLPAIDNDPVLSRVLGAWVLRQSCAAAMQRGEQLHVSVNISPHHLDEPSFADHVTQILRVTGFSPTRLILELTEASIVGPTPTVLTNCMALTDLGVSLALDDFVAGRVDGDTLDALPLEILKLDRAVIAGIGVDPEADQLVLETLDLAASTGRRTIAVGVESHEQARFLRDHEATFAQGYLYGRPQPR